MSTSPSVVSQGPSLYEDDLHEWASRQASLIRANRIDELDLAHIAEELDDVGSELYRRLESSFTVLFAHMLKWDHQPERRSRSCEATIREQRKRVVRLLEKNPSLRSKLAEAMAEGYEYGSDRASGEADFRIAPDTLSSGIRRATGSRSVLAVSGFRLRARLDFSIPSCSPGQRGITHAFGYSAPHPSAEGTSTPMIHALPSAHYDLG